MFKVNNWIKKGLFFGLFMFFGIVIFFPLISPTEEITVRKLLLGIPVWIFGGLLYGYAFYKVSSKKNNISE